MIYGMLGIKITFEGFTVCLINKQEFKRETFSEDIVFVLNKELEYLESCEKKMEWYKHNHNVKQSIFDEEVIKEKYFIKNILEFLYEYGEVELEELITNTPLKKLITVKKDEKVLYIVIVPLVYPESFDWALSYASKSDLIDIIPSKTCQEYREDTGSFKCLTITINKDNEVEGSIWAAMLLFRRDDIYLKDVINYMKIWGCFKRLWFHNKQSTNIFGVIGLVLEKELDRHGSFLLGDLKFKIITEGVAAGYVIDIEDNKYPLGVSEFNEEVFRRKMITTVK